MAAKKQTSSIQDWLESLDLGNFTNHFLLNGLTELHQVCHITEDQLSLIGITQRGYQKRILNHLPSEAEAFLSEFVTGSEKLSTDGKDTSGEAPPPMPPRRSAVKQVGKENGHPTGRKPTFDDESYLFLPSRPHSDSDRPSTGSISQTSLGDFKHVPVPPPRAPGSQGKGMALSSEIPNNQARMRPTPQPRARSDPSLGAKPPPLPGRDENPERPSPKLQPTPQVPPRVAPSQAAPQVPLPLKLFPTSFVEPNVYDDDPCQCVKPPESNSSNFLSPPPVFPKAVPQSSAQDAIDEPFPELPPPPPPKSFPGSAMPPAPAKRNVSPVPHLVHRRPPDPPNLESPSSQPRSLNDDILVDSRKSALQMPEECTPPPAKDSLLSPPPVLPFQSPSLCGSEEDNVPSLPPPPVPTTIPSIPPRPHLGEHPPISDVPPPPLPSKETPGHLQAFQMSGIQGGTSSVPFLPEPTSSIPIIPPRPPPSLLPGPSPSELQPLPHPQSLLATDPLPAELPPPPPMQEETPGHSDFTQPHQTDFVNIFDSAKETRDPFAFDPFTNNTEGTFSVDPPLRPPSLFLTQEDLERFPKPQLSVPPPVEELPSQSEQPVPLHLSRPAPNLSLLNRPVPLPPASDVLAPTGMPPIPQDHTPLETQYQALPELTKAGEGLTPHQSGELTSTTVVSQSGLRKPPAPPPRIPAGTEQKVNRDTAASPDITSSDQPTCMPAGLFHKTSDLIDLSSLETNAVTFKNVPAENERKSFLDTEYSDKPSRSTASPLLPVLHDPDDQYSKVHRSPKITQRCVSGEKKETPSIPQIPTRPPQIPPRQEPKGEAAPTFTGPERLSPIGSATQDDMYSVVGESRVTSWSSLQVPVPASPSGLSDSSDRHSYILLSEAMSGGHDIPDEKIYPDERPLPAVPLSSSTLDKPGERDAFQMEEDLPRSQHSQKPVRRAPPPPVVRPSEKSPSHIPKIPPRPAPAVKEFIPQLPPGKKEEEYDLLDPSRMVHTSPLRDEPVEGSVAFKELAQSEESGDDDDSGFDMDSLEFSKAGVKEDSDSDLNFKIDLADRRSKIDLSHVLRIGQAYQPEVPNRRLTRTHSRALDENTRKRLSKKLSQSLQDRNSAAETPTNKVTILTKQGYLWKQGGKQNNKGFRKRWMVFDGLEMRYYENEKKLSECKGIIPVGTMRDVKNLCGNTRPGFGDTRQYRIILETTGRSFHFAAETLDEGTLWANVLMQAILSYEPPPGGFPVGGDMSCPDKQGYVKIEGYHQKRFLAVKGERLFMYNTAMDFESAVAILDIQMKLASVKELPKNKLQLATPGKIYILTLENPQDVKDWMIAMKDAIEEGLSDHSILEQMYQNPSNKYCADCRMKDPDWASINLGICVCKNCSGLHRELGVHLSKVRSLKMDTKVWTPALVQLIMDLGNDRSNAFWEAHLNEDEKAVPDDTLERRKVYIVGKYRDRKYCKPRLITDKNMNRTLLKAASLGNLEECVQLVFSGANVSYTREDGKTACDVAKECNFPVVAEFLNQNVGIKIVPGKNDAASGTSEQGEKKLSTVRHMARESKQEFIKKSGYLHKTGNNKKEFLKRFCTLEHGIFSYFEEKSQPAKNTIEGIEMILIAVTEPRQGHKFCFEIYTSPGRTYLLSAETEEDRKEWMIALAKIHSLECMWGCLEDFEQAGFLHKKEGAAATNWQRLWFILKGKSVVSFSSTNDQLEEIDLRKLISLSRQDSDSTSATDYTHTLSIVLPGKNIYLRAETKQAADCWYEAINRLASQGGQALEDQLLTGDNIPIIVSQCINFVATHDGIMTEGIYRLSGTSSVIRKIVTSFTEDPRTARLKEEYTVHDVTGALKKFFRELPDPLLTSRLYKKWTEVASYQDHSIRLQWYQHLLSELPPVNYHTLKMLIGHLKNVADHSDFNKMYFRNLAAIFGPTLMASPDSSYIHAEYEIAVIADLLTYYNWLYQVSEEEMAKEREKELKYQEGLSKIKAARASENIGEQLILMEIFLGKKDLGNSINIKISMDHTAAEIIKMALDQQKEINDGTWALFEIIAKGELERLIHGYERVLPQVLAWNAQMAPDNYICLKHNDLMDRIEPFMQQATLSDIVRYSESKKTFKKYSFELMNNVITCYKDKSTTPANSWKVADMKIYVGVEKKRSPPTQWGISFTLNNEEGMRAMCLEKEASFLFWLAGLLKSKVVDPSSLTYSPHALSFKSEHESSFTRYSRNLPRELSNITSKMSFWRKSRTNSVDES
ncbi:arf-GAP with Rho-GAP domain, ANK repeat and PH domain-containing protein 1-like isoform X2 [Acanthaster planci]|uniref:Arf-GAP with Rho-GAP domain, ANK repeat and PH domain-containing protein 1-like isoform X2 n=1 Tax=Acanthaster planci TaxID=133434 RepID=A0A8B7XGS8_ACAPL|nr:arf-GAP with Rho-GAP domain, ANK repeat and PH domain-containing protein 1-like isoform X2 [Acanthaster planci]